MRASSAPISTILPASMSSTMGLPDSYANISGRSSAPARVVILVVRSAEGMYSYSQLKLGFTLSL